MTSTVLEHPTAKRFRITPEVRRALRADLYPLVPGSADHLSDEEFENFLVISESRQLDPVKRQIYATKRWNTRLGRKVMSVEATIDGLRLIAMRTREYRGETKTMWADRAGQWFDAWLPAQNEPPAAAMIGVWRDGFKEPKVAVAHWDEYVQRDRDGTVIAMWQSRPRLMLAKCAAAAALRAAFPDEIAGLYTEEELAREHDGPDTPTPTPAAGAVIAGSGALAALTAGLGYGVRAAHALAHLASAGQPLDQLAPDQLERASAWAQAAHAAGVDEEALTGCVEYVITNSHDWPHAQQRFDTWVAQKTAASPPPAVAPVGPIQPVAVA